MTPIRLDQQGFAAIAAIFLVVILAAFGAFMVSFSNTQQLNSARDVQGSRAYWAARAGLEWAIVAIPANPALCADPVVAPPTPIDGFTINLHCFQENYLEGVAPVIINRFESVASQGAVGTVGYIERSVSASMER
ncbi:MAG: hypothetical protein ACYC4S_10705 [Rhodoferax sp.]